MDFEVNNPRNPRWTSDLTIELTINRYEGGKNVGTFEIGTAEFDEPTKELFLAAKRGDFGKITEISNG